MLVLVERAKAPEDVSHLSDDEPQIGELEWNVFKPQKRRGVGLMAREDRGVQLEGWKRDTALYAALDLEEFEMHVDGVAKLGLALFERAEFRRFARFGAPGRSGAAIHPAIIQSHKSQVTSQNRQTSIIDGKACGS